MADNFVRSDEIQEGMITYLKSRSAITALVSSTEIRERQWQGTTFTYPNIRVRITDNRPTDRNGCLQIANISVQVFSELPTSDQVEQIAGIIANEINGNQFVSSGVAFGINVTNVIGAIRQDTRTWRSEVLAVSRIN